ncbi:MAG: S1 family peptidase [Myxococcales bacterium]|nr:S1 family peptidase [Myxococcales bacterium]MCB9701749.1 S1 family peptidase [Myxococcales bacterium]
MALPWALLGLASLVASAPITDRPPAADGIYGGERVAPGDWPSVVAVQLDDLLCTGTLVDPHVVLTAAHCFRANPATNKVRIYFGDESVLPSFQTVAASYGVHPDFCSNAATCGEDIHDFAWIYLTDPAPAEFPPSKILNTQAVWDDLMFIGQDVTLVGFGVNEHQLMGIKREAKTTLTGFSESGLEFEAGGMGIDSCRGDSGGPAFIGSGADARLIGVLSRGYDCGDGGIYGVPYPILCWVSDQTGVDLRPPGCASCKCLDTDPEGHGCNRCDAGPGAKGDALAILLPFAVALGRRRRRRALAKLRRDARDDDKATKAADQYQRSATPIPAPLTKRVPSKINIPS